MPDCLTMKPHFLKRPAALLIALLAACSLLTACDTSPPPPLIKFHATSLRNPDFAKAFSLTDHNGQARTLKDWQGKVVLLFFGYTQCPDVCPTALSRAAETMQLLGADADKVQILFVTLDPQRDTPELLKQYVPAFDPRFLGLYTNAAATPQLAKDFRIFYRTNPGSTPTTYTIDHTASTYAYSPKGELRLVIPHDASAADVAADIRQLLTTPAENP